MGVEGGPGQELNRKQCDVFHHGPAKICSETTSQEEAA